MRTAIVERLPQEGAAMSTIVAMPSSAPLQNSVWVPSPLYRLSLDQYEAMLASSAFGDKDRFHLINGFLVAKMPQNNPHCTADDLCGKALNHVLPLGWYVRASKPVRLPPGSMPEPDRCVVRGTIRDYSTRSPGPTDVALIAEFADSGLLEDRNLGRIYADSGIPIYWIVNLVDRQVEVYTNPGVAGYQSTEIFKAGQNVPVTIDGVLAGQIPVAELLP
jgi:Uma2 family endonuclease